MKDLDPANPFDHGSEMFKKNFLKTKWNIPATTKGYTLQAENCYQRYGHILLKISFKFYPNISDFKH